MKKLVTNVFPKRKLPKSDLWAIKFVSSFSVNLHEWKYNPNQRKDEKKTTS